MKLETSCKFSAESIIFSGKRKDNEEVIFGNYYHQTEFFGEECDMHFIITSSDCIGNERAMEYHAIEFDSLKIIIS